MYEFVHQTFMCELINRIKVKKPVSEQDQTQFGMNVDVCFSKLILSCVQTQIHNVVVSHCCANVGDKTR